MRASVSDVTNAILVVCALTVTGLVVRQQLFVAGAAGYPAPTQVDGWERIAQDGHRLGPESAPVQIVEFGDYQCPYCGTADAVLQDLIASTAGGVSVVYRHYPLQQLHPHAFAAALAVECAAAQARFHEFHVSLFANADSIGVWPWSRFAELAAVGDAEAFGSCMDSQEYADRVQRDIAVAESLGIQGTPTFIVNGRMFTGSPQGQPLEQYLRDQLPSQIVPQPRE